MEQIPCPHCQAQLRPYDRGSRKYVDTAGDWRVLVIRRLRCINPRCRRIHAELPDFLVPYKRYGVGSIEAVLTGAAPAARAEESTRWRWQRWYRQLRAYFLGVALDGRTPEQAFLSDSRAMCFATSGQLSESFHRHLYTII